MVERNKAGSQALYERASLCLSHSHTHTHTHTHAHTHTHQLEDVVERNKAGLQALYGRAYKKVFKDIKALRPGEIFEMPSGMIARLNESCHI